MGSYLLLIDFTGRLFRDGKAAISAEVAGILERLGSNAESWWCRIEKLSNGRLLGRFFAVNRQRLRDVARRLGVHHLANLGGCVARSGRETGAVSLPHLPDDEQPAAPVDQTGREPRLCGG